MRWIVHKILLKHERAHPTANKLEWREIDSKFHQFKNIKLWVSSEIKIIVVLTTKLERNWKYAALSLWLLCALWATIQLCIFFRKNVQNYYRVNILLKSLSSIITSCKFLLKSKCFEKTMSNMFWPWCIKHFKWISIKSQRDSHKSKYL